MTRLRASAALALAVLVFGGRQGRPMPLHPDLVGRFRTDRSFSSKVSPVLTSRKLYRAKQSQQVSGSRKVLVLVVDFSDKTFSYTTPSFQSMLFSVSTFASGSLRDYYREVSYGTFDVDGQVAGWFRMPQSYSYYAYNYYGLGTYPNNAQKLVEDALAAADPTIDFSQFDSDGDGWIDGLFVIHAGQGAEATGDTGDIWSHQASLHSVTVLDGVKIYDYTMEPELFRSGMSTVGVFCHEFAHFLGLPDLYDYGYDSAGVGDWSIMASGSWLGPSSDGSKPAHFDAWCLTQLGWVSPVVPTQNSSGVAFPDVEENQTIYKLWTDGAPSNEYFLVENRQKKLFDAYLPGDGLLIYHVDENQSNNNDQTHYLVKVMQADGLEDLEQYVNLGDAGDAWPGTMTNRNFNDISTPSSRSYSGMTTNVGVLTISDSGDSMTADVTVNTSSIAKPSNISPANGETSVSLTPRLEASAYQSGNGTDHKTSQWQVSITPGDYADPVFDSGEGSPAAITCDVPSGFLAFQTVCYWHVRYQDTNDEWSSWSDETAFTTRSGAGPDKPVNQLPADGATGVSPTLTLTASTYYNSEGISQKANRWQITTTSGSYTHPVMDATVSGQTSFYTVPAGMLAKETFYFWRVRYQDDLNNWSDWSDETGFTTRENQAPSQPANISPPDDGGGAALDSVLSGTAFSDPDGDTMGYARWRLWKDGETAFLWQGTSATVSVEIPGGVLAYSVKYRWQVQYADKTGKTSLWSPETSFTTEPMPQAPPVKPTNILPATGAFAVSLTPVLMGDGFSDPNGDGIKSSAWRVRDGAGSYLDPVWQNEDAGPVTSVTIPEGALEEATLYFWQTRYQDSADNWSDWSDETSFTSPSVPSPSSPSSVSGGGGGGGCFIATACFGERSPEVTALKKLRDGFLLRTGWGTAVVSSYYRWSPGAAGWLDRHGAVKPVVRILLWPVVGIILSMEHARGIVIALFSILLLILTAFFAVSRHIHEDTTGGDTIP